MAVDPFPIQVLRDSKWSTVQTDVLIPGDIVSISTFLFFLLCSPLHLGSLCAFCYPPLSARGANETTVPADMLLLRGTCIVNEAMLSGESTPLLKESIELLEPTEALDADNQHKGNMLFSGTKVLQATNSASGAMTPDGGCLAVVLRTGFGTTQGQLVRTMIFSTERVSANNFESFLFIGFLLIFAIAASWYVWTHGES